MKSKSKNAEKQFVYRQKVKTQGGLYVGVYVRGQTASVLKAAKAANDKSYSEIISEALRLSLAGVHLAEIEPVTKAPDEYEWENIK